MLKTKLNSLSEKSSKLISGMLSTLTSLGTILTPVVSANFEVSQTSIGAKVTNNTMELIKKNIKPLIITTVGGLGIVTLIGGSIGIKVLYDYIKGLSYTISHLTEINESNFKILSGDIRKIAKGENKCSKKYKEALRLANKLGQKIAELKNKSWDMDFKNDIDNCLNSAYKLAFTEDNEESVTSNSSISLFTSSKKRFNDSKYQERLTISEIEDNDISEEIKIKEEIINLESHESDIDSKVLISEENQSIIDDITFNFPINHPYEISNDSDIPEVIKDSIYRNDIDSSRATSDIISSEDDFDSSGNHKSSSDSIIDIDGNSDISETEDNTIKDDEKYTTNLIYYRTIGKKVGIEYQCNDGSIKNEYGLDKTNLKEWLTGETFLYQLVDIKPDWKERINTYKFKTGGIAKICTVYMAEDKFLGVCDMLTNEVYVPLLLKESNKAEVEGVLQLSFKENICSVIWMKNSEQDKSLQETLLTEKK